MKSTRASPVVVFVDAENIFTSLHQSNTDYRLNIYNLIAFLRETFGDFRMYVFGHFSSTRGLPPWIRLSLNKFPFIYVFETRVDDGSEPRSQEADEAIINSLLEKDIGLEANADLYEHIVIMSGDGSLFGMALKAFLMGKKVSIVAAGPDSLNRVYQDVGFDIVFLEDHKDRFMTPKPTGVTAGETGQDTLAEDV